MRAFTEMGSECGSTGLQSVKGAKIVALSPASFQCSSPKMVQIFSITSAVLCAHGPSCGQAVAVWPPATGRALLLKSSILCTQHYVTLNNLVVSWGLS